MEGQTPQLKTLRRASSSQSSLKSSTRVSRFESLRVLKELQVQQTAQTHSIQLLKCAVQLKFASIQKKSEVILLIDDQYSLIIALLKGVRVRHLITTSNYSIIIIAVKQENEANQTWLVSLFV
ncbi:hypothetical protein FGO68_gene5767 [Halteria grandinella]|uniref:Uncharacterized protein n=1 Tax=Halteria grandinella TaxID=5974 RepID=A0A8J8P4E9_HALGN|nr:hypothetical protein FGO68_gene5767 [Halteria grandinella]